MKMKILDVWECPDPPREILEDEEKFAVWVAEQHAAREAWLEQFWALCAADCQNTAH